MRAFHPHPYGWGIWARSGGSPLSVLWSSCPRTYFSTFLLRNAPAQEHGLPARGDALQAEKEDVLEIQANSKTCPVSSALLLLNAPAQDNYAAAWTQRICFPCETLCRRISSGALTTTRGDGAVALSPLARHSFRVGWERLVLLCFSCSLARPYAFWAAIQALASCRSRVFS